MDRQTETVNLLEVDTPGSQDLEFSVQSQPVNSQDQISSGNSQAPDRDFEFVSLLLLVLLAIAVII